MLPETSLTFHFLQEMDGLANNDGLFVVASTNYLEKLDPGLTKRPSRFDRKYKFPLPNEHERTLYCDYWRKKRVSKSISFPKKLAPAMAHITGGFSFAFLQECFVATLLVLAREQDDGAASRPYDDSNDDLDDYRLWVVFKREADILRKEIDSQAKTGQSQLAAWCKPGSEPSGDDFALTASMKATSVRDRHCGCCRCRGEEATPFALASSRPIMRDELLPELPWYAQKQREFTATAFEMK